MAKKEIGQIKLQIPGGDAKPAPPVGPALGQLGVPIMPFCKEFNAKTQDMAGTIIPVVITVYQDKSFTFILKSPPAAELLKKAAGIAAGSGEPNKEKVGRWTYPHWAGSACWQSHWPGVRKGTPQTRCGTHSAWLRTGRVFAGQSRYRLPPEIHKCPVGCRRRLRQ